MVNWQDFVDEIKPNLIKLNEPIESHANRENKVTAKLYAEIDKIDNLIKVVTKARIHKIPFFILGSGSWTKIPDGEIHGLVIKNNCRKFDMFGIDKKVIYAESGTIFNQLTRFTIEEGMSGLEYQLGLPGTVGGAIYTNARYTPKKTYVNDVVDKIRIINEQNEIQEVGNDYFISRSHTEFFPAKAVILSAIFRLFPKDKKILWERGNEAVTYRTKKYE